MDSNNPRNLPAFKRPEYRVIDFLSMTGYRWLSSNLPYDVYHDLKKPLAEIKAILSESLYGEKYKTKRLHSETNLYLVSKKLLNEIDGKEA